MTPTPDQTASAARLVPDHVFLTAIGIWTKGYGDDGDIIPWQPTADTEAGRSDAFVLETAVLHWCDNNPLSDEVYDAHDALIEVMHSGNPKQRQQATFAAAVAIGEYIGEKNNDH